MDTSYKDLLLKLLEAIDYADDKEAFVNEFMGLVQFQAIADLLRLVSTEQQEKIKNDFISSQNNPEKLNEILKTYFTDEQINKALEDASKNAVTGWMQEVNPTLSDLQRQKLLSLSQELVSAPAA